jgi:hypothetical protein
LGGLDADPSAGSLEKLEWAILDSEAGRRDTNEDNSMASSSLGAMIASGQTFVPSPYHAHFQQCA